MVIMSVVTAALTIAAAAADFVRPQWILANMSRYGVPHAWLPVLGAVKAAGGLGLLAGLAVPALGLAAAAGLVLYFLGAVGTVVRARCWSHLPSPGLFLALSIGCALTA
ncbi:DoxX family protein [Dactylosporangium cerinum]|uniref:DoxX family protein n=1 Tax=Dactylosporangium cerinum TaxID=1434730 RepID=A0ABV9W4W8_9ACTN